MNTISYPKTFHLQKSFKRFHSKLCNYSTRWRVQIKRASFLSSLVLAKNVKAKTKRYCIGKKFFYWAHLKKSEMSGAHEWNIILFEIIHKNWWLSWWYSSSSRCLMTITSYATYNNTLLASNKGSWWVQMRYLMCFPSLFPLSSFWMEMKMNTNILWLPAWHA